MMSIKDESKVYLEVKSISEINENELQLLKLSQLEGLAPIQIWTACGTNQQMGYSTHGIFRYFGKFPPVIASYLINKYTLEGDTVFDPMCGSGTTGVEALILKRNFLLNDINPLSILLSKVKTTYLSKDLLRSYAEKLYCEYRPLKFSEYQFEPAYLKNYKHWFLPETVDSLRGLKYLIQQIENSDVKDFFNVCFAGTVRRVSRATTQQGRLFLDINTAEIDALPFFIKKVELAIERISTLSNDNNSEIFSHDIRTPLPDSKIDCADLIICHPPYFNSYKYSSINSLELSWLDINYSDLRKKEVKEFFKVGKESNAQFYVNDMVQSLINLHKALKKDSVLGLMIGDTTIHGNYLPVTKQILDKISEYYIIELIALRAPKYTEAAWVASQRRQKSSVGITLYDFIIILRKKS